MKKVSKNFGVQINFLTFVLALELEHNILSKQGEMVEWSITTVLKTVALRGAGGSNPSLSANRL